MKAIVITPDLSDAYNNLHNLITEIKVFIL